MRRRLASALLMLALAAALCACGRSSWQYRPIEDVNDLQGRRVAVNLAWETDYWLTQRRDLQVLRYDSLADMIMALRFDKVDAIAVDDLLWKLMESGSQGLHRVTPAFGASGYTLYFSPENTVLMNEFNAYLAAYRQTADYQDHLARLDAFDGQNYEGPDIALTGTGEVLRVAIDAAAFPRAFLEAGQSVPTGFDLEALKYFANEKNYRLEFFASNFEDIVYGLKAGVYDVGTGYLSDVYEADVLASGLYTSDALDTCGMYFIEKTQPDIFVNTEELE